MSKIVAITIQLEQEKSHMIQGNYSKTKQKKKNMCLSKSKFENCPSS